MTGESEHKLKIRLLSNRAPKPIFLTGRILHGQLVSLTLTEQASLKVSFNESPTLTGTPLIDSEGTPAAESAERAGAGT